MRECLKQALAFTGQFQKEDRGNKVVYILWGFSVLETPLANFISSSYHYNWTTPNVPLDQWPFYLLISIFFFHNYRKENHSKPEYWWIFFPQPSLSFFLFSVFWKAHFLHPNWQLCFSFNIRHTTYSSWTFPCCQEKASLDHLSLGWL